MDALVLLDPAVIAFTALGLCIFALMLMLIIMIRQTKLLRRYRLLLNGDAAKDLESILLDYGHDLEQMKKSLTTLDSRVSTLASDAQTHVQRTGIVRFNAFQDTGSDLSFAIALLDANDNGFVLSSLYGRNESRIYAKPVRSGTSTYTLSAEEKKALAQARGEQN